MNFQCFVEIAGKEKSLIEAPENWKEVLTTDSQDTLYFGGEESTDEKIQAITIPSSGQSLAPVFRVTQSITGSNKTLVVPNYGKAGLAGKYAFAIKFIGSEIMASRPRIEAWDSAEDVDLNTPTHEILTGTNGTLANQCLGLMIQPQYQQTQVYHRNGGLLLL